VSDRRSFGQITGLEVDPDRPAVLVDRLTERFRLYHERPTGLKERLYRLRRSSYTEFNALENVSLTVEHGESVGIIGHNGSGKSTLLRLLARILPPDEGEVVTNGRVATLLELGAGFHGDLTGRENIYLNGAILGLSRSEIDHRFDEIVDFAGIRPLLDTAVRTYSSGLYVRLGFAIAVTVDPDILLVDEVLAVGDAEFQARSLDRMRRFHQDGKTILLVSHDLEAVQEMCDRAVVLANGRVVFDGPVDDGVEHYRRRIARTAAARAAAVEPAEDPPVSIAEATLLDPQGAPVGEVPTGGPAVLRMRLVALRDFAASSVGIQVADPNGVAFYRYLSSGQGVGIGPLEAGDDATVEVSFLAPRRSGEYEVTGVAAPPDGSATWALAPASTALRVTVPDGAGSGVDLAASVTVVDGPATAVIDLDVGEVADPHLHSEPGSPTSRADGEGSRPSRDGEGPPSRADGRGRSSRADVGQRHRRTP
jgi:ABC-type polysaccharide/polyol phosphate transport system ATPase subunit